MGRIWFSLSSFRGRAPPARLPPGFSGGQGAGREIELFRPASNWEETPEAYLLKLHLPGFMRDGLKVTFKIDVFEVVGETKWRRFHESYPVPQNSSTFDATAKYVDEVLIITIPKIVTIETPIDQKLFLTPSTVKPQSSDDHTAAGKAEEPQKQETEVGKKEDISPKKEEVKMVLSEEQMRAIFKKFEEKETNYS